MRPFDTDFRSKDAKAKAKATSKAKQGGASHAHQVRASEKGVLVKASTMNALKRGIILLDAAEATKEFTRRYGTDLNKLRRTSPRSKPCQGPAEPA